MLFSVRARKKFHIRIFTGVPSVCTYFECSCLQSFFGLGKTLYLALAGEETRKPLPQPPEPRSEGHDGRPEPPISPTVWASLGLPGN